MLYQIFFLIFAAFILLLKSSFRDDIKNVLKSIQADGGGDCPDPSLSGTKLGLEKSLKGSYVFVFTDASPKDKELTAEVVFIITPASSAFCRHQKLRNFSPYYKIALASSGQVFRLSTKGELKEVLPYVEEVAKGPKSGILDKVLPANESSSVEFAVDNKTDYAIVSASSQDINLNIKSGPKKSYEKIVWTNNVKIIKLTGPGKYVLEVNGSSDKSVKVYGRTDFTFQHGFSNYVPTVFNANEKQPTTETESNLLISIDDPVHSVNVESALILDMHEKVIQELPLRKVSENYYATEKFVPPTTMFKIAVKSKEVNSGKILIRSAKTPIEPKTETPYTPVSNSTKDDENIIKVKEYDSITITCNAINVNPLPNITWEFKGRVIAKNAVLHIKDVTRHHSGDYTCIADNKSGRATQIVKLEVKESHLNSTVDGSQEVTSSSSSPESSKTDQDEFNPQPNQRRSDDYHFLMSILPELEKIPSANKLRLRNKINQLIMEEMKIVCF